MLFGKPVHTQVKVQVVDDLPACDTSKPLPTALPKTIVRHTSKTAYQSLSIQANHIEAPASQGEEPARANLRQPEKSESRSGSEHAFRLEKSVSLQVTSAQRRGQIIET